MWVVMGKGGFVGRQVQDAAKKLREATIAASSRGAREAAGAVAGASSDTLDSVREMSNGVDAAAVRLAERPGSEARGRVGLYRAMDVGHA